MWKRRRREGGGGERGLVGTCTVGVRRGGSEAERGVKQREEGGRKEEKRGSLGLLSAEGDPLLSLMPPIGGSLHPGVEVAHNSRVLQLSEGLHLTHHLLSCRLAAGDRCCWTVTRPSRVQAPILMSSRSWQLDPLHRILATICPVTDMVHHTKPTST